MLLVGGLGCEELSKGEEGGIGRKKEEGRGRRTSFVTVSRFGLFMLLVVGLVRARREVLARVEVRCARTS